MGWPKQKIIEEAFGELALAGHVFDLSPDELQAALRRLDTMMATWQAKGIRLGYAFASDTVPSKLDDDSGIADSAVEAVFLNLAKRLAASYGKQLRPSTLATAKEAYDMLLGKAAMPPEQQFPGTLAVGAGNKPWRTQGSPFMPQPADLVAGTDPIDLT